ncbi:MAG: COQ9 family protein [Cereibacter sphaeroides]|uniref:COQ9 family protein n=1 Tax=Cereibacter sphaeroides TaxID=1063 RepID=A0A2W5TQ28_CERSP|nr:MAG: COQ9 family protein [Cereibacter sphaeroides]
MTTETPTEDARLRDALLDAALAHVAFDGWSDATFRAAVADTGIDPVLARSFFPRGAVDLALAFHRRGDQAMVRRMAETDLGAMRYSERVAFAIRARLEAVADKEAVRRGTTLFSLPHHAPDGARAIWGTADAIWTALGDSSRDINWYSKRATLSAVYGATVLFWLGDDSTDNHATWEFLDRRIADVMRIEKFKAQVRDNPLGKLFLGGPGKILDRVKAPARRDDLPGHTRY